LNKALFLLIFLLFCVSSSKAENPRSLMFDRSQKFIQHTSGEVKLQFDSLIEQSKEGHKYFEGPFGISIGFDQRIYIADDLGHTIYIFNKFHTLLKTIGKKGQRVGEFAWVDAVISDKQGRLYVADTGNDRVQILDGLGRRPQQEHHLPW